MLTYFLIFFAMFSSDRIVIYKKLCFVQKSTSKDSLIVEISVIAYVLFPYAKTMVVLQRNRQEEAVGNSKYY